MVQKHDVSDATKNLVRLGLASKGAIYMLIGILAILPIIGMGQGGGTGGSKHAIKWLMDQSYGPYIVGVIALGLLFFALYRFMRAFRDSPRYSGIKGKVKRVGRAISGLFYGAFAVYAGSLVVQSFSGGGGSSSGGNQKYQIIQELLQSSWGKVVLIIVGAALIGRSLYFI